MNVLSSTGQVLGWFQQKVFSLGGAFRVFDTDGNEVAEVKGDWKGWNFRFVDAAEEGDRHRDQEMGRAGQGTVHCGRQLHHLDRGAQARPANSALLLAAGLAIDIVYKENG